MKSLTQFIKESLVRSIKEHDSDEVDAIVDILTMAQLYTNKKSYEFVDALYKEAEKLYKNNSDSSVYFFFVNKQKLTKFIEQNLETCCEYGPPHYEVKFEWKKSHDIEGDNTKEVISTLWKGLDLDKEQVYKDNFGTIYSWKTGIYANSKYGEVCLYSIEP